MEFGERERAVEVLCDASLAHVVDMVAWADGNGHEREVVVANAGGAVRLAAGSEAQVPGWGRSPLACTDPMAFLPYDVELADPSPVNAHNAYPYPSARLHSLFADPRAPDLVVVHTPGHYFPDRGGHLGEHGSLDVVQSRAPLLLSGAGVEPRGMLDDHARIVDVAATLARLAGVPAEALADMDGRPLDRLARPGAAHVVGLLWDGVNCGELLRLVQAGELPNAARLLAGGCALRGGAVAEFPSVTLCNHTSALTGVGPGRHGVIGNVFWDRVIGEVVVPNDETTWHRSAEWLRPRVSTVYERIEAARPGAMTASVNEPIDRGAGYSTMALIRSAGSNGAGTHTSLLPPAADSPYASKTWVAVDARYAWSTRVDDAGLDQVLALWPAGEPAAWPLFTWWNSTLTDTAHHAGGPRSPVAEASMRDTDRRLGVFLDHLDTIGAYDDTVFLLTADHGFEGADIGCTGDWDEPLRRAGLEFRDEGPGFVYLGDT